MDQKMTQLDVVKGRLDLSEVQFHKLLSVIKKRHEADQWIITRKSKMGDSTRYLKMEAQDWIEQVYFRDPKEPYLEAEIKFARKHIARLEVEMQTHKSILPKDAMPIRELASYLERSRSSIYKSVRVLSLHHPEWIKQHNQNIVIDPDGISWIIRHCYKSIYFRKLSEYKIALQEQKRKEFK